MNKKNNLILLELNEINFKVIKDYIDSGIVLSGFEQILHKGILNTFAETEYDLLEPWIQWPSVHTGLTYNEHKVFRLGDIVNHQHEQIFEKIESLGYKVGAVSPMNASNNLKNPAYFIPDPWTKTDSDGSYFSEGISKAVSQAVNDNASSKLTFRTIFSLCISFLALVHPKKWISMTSYALGSIGKPWRKALFLDKLLYEIHKTLLDRKKPGFSTLFLNAGAHIQHHYFFNSPATNGNNLKNPEWYIKENQDPMLEMLIEYDLIIKDLVTLSNTEIIISTGLSQKPYEKIKFYYRLTDHENFLNILNIKFKDVQPRMTRDFLVNFDTKQEAKDAEIKLGKLFVDNSIKLFAEIDNRGNSLFVVLTYPSQIDINTMVTFENMSLKLIDHTTFVSIKNGEHSPIGYSFFSEGIANYAPNDGAHVSKIHDSILNYFND